MNKIFEMTKMSTKLVNLTQVPGFITWSWDTTGSAPAPVTANLTYAYDGNRLTASTIASSKDNGTATTNATLIATLAYPMTIERIYAQSQSITERYGSGQTAVTTLAINGSTINTLSGFNTSPNVQDYLYDNSTLRVGVTQVTFNVYISGNHSDGNVTSYASHYELELYGRI